MGGQKPKDQRDQRRNHRHQKRIQQGGGQVIIGQNLCVAFPRYPSERGHRQATFLKAECHQNQDGQQDEDMGKGQIGKGKDPHFPPFPPFYTRSSRSQRLLAR
jgi:hypothetical protein